MTFAALVLAGGAGERMRVSSGKEIAKPLVQVRGASLLERNVCALLRADVTRIFVACLEAQASVRAEVARLAEQCRRRGIRLEPLLETTPRGTIGAAGLLRGRVETLLSVNADNLCALDLNALAQAHLRTRADLTLAAHSHVSRLPYGELRVERDRVVEYREKPARTTRICSAICVLGPAALAVLDGAAGLNDLTRMLLARHHDVRAYDHQTAWIDVNEAEDVSTAATLVAQNWEVMERWAPAADLEVVGALLWDGDRLLLERRSEGTAAEHWDTPGGKLEPGESPTRALKRELREELQLEVVEAGSEVSCFDMLDDRGRIIRHHVFAVAVQPWQVQPNEGQMVAWFELSELPRNRSRVVDRSLAWRDGNKSELERT